jgi:Fe-S oxidoreductase
MTMALEDFRADAMRCTRCTYCRWIPFDLVKSARFAKGCPSIDYGRFHTYSAGGRLIAALSLMDGRSTVTERVKDAAFKCTMCGQCDVSCKVCRYDMEPLDAMRELRFALVEQGHTLPQAAPVIESLRSQFNMLGHQASARGDWARTLAVKDLTTGKAEVCFHAGCRYSFDGDLGHVARTSVKILQKAGVDVGILGRNEQCCGGRAFNMGYREDFDRKARRNLSAWQKAGVTTIVTPCADCFHAFKRSYASEAGSGFEVLHMVQYVDRLIKDGRMKFTKAVPMKVTYHDPCHLGRQGEDYVPWKGKEKKIFGQAVAYDPPRPRYSGAFGVYDPPRDVLRAIPGIQLVEMERIQEAAWCCGAGGGAAELFPPFARATATERLDEAMSTGADAIVSACPWCERMFTDTADSSDQRLEVFDVIALAGRALGIEEGV